MPLYAPSVVNGDGLSFNSTSFSTLLAIGLLSREEYATIGRLFALLCAIACAEHCSIRCFDILAAIVGESQAAGPLLYELGTIATFLFYFRMQLRQRGLAERRPRPKSGMDAELSDPLLATSNGPSISNQRFSLAPKTKLRKRARQQEATRRCHRAVTQRLAYLVSRWGAFQSYFLIPMACLCCLAWALVLPSFLSALLLVWACLAVVGIDCCSDKNALRSQKHARSNAWIRVPIGLGCVAILIDYAANIRFYDPTGGLVDELPRTVRLVC